MRDCPTAPMWLCALRLLRSWGTAPLGYCAVGLLRRWATALLGFCALGPLRRWATAASAPLGFLEKEIPPALIKPRIHHVRKRRAKRVADVDAAVVVVACRELAQAKQYFFL